MADNIDALGIRGLPSPLSNNVRGPVRANRYGELVAALGGSNLRQTLADEGSYFVFHNATNDAATTLAGHPAPILADADATMTKPLIHIVNSDSSTSLVRGYLDYIEIEVITAAATGTQACWAAQLDTGATRITTAGTALTLVNPNMQSSATAVLTPTGGAIVTGAESANVRHLGHGTFRPSIEVAGDKYLFLFGADPSVVSPTVAAASVRNFVQVMPPVILGPTDFFMLALHSQAAVNAAGVYKVRGGFFQR